MAGSTSRGEGGFAPVCLRSLPQDISGNRKLETLCLFLAALDIPVCGAPLKRPALLPDAAALHV